MLSRHTKRDGNFMTMHQMPRASLSAFTLALTSLLGCSGENDDKPTAEVMAVGGGSQGGGTQIGSSGGTDVPGQGGATLGQGGAVFGQGGATNPSQGGSSTLAMGGAGQGGNTWGQGGETTGQGGNTWGQGGETTGQGGNTWGQGGNTWGQGGNTWGQGGETTGQGGETTGQGGETTGQGGNTWGQGGETTGQGGETTGQGGETTGQGGETTGQGGETTGVGGNTAIDDGCTDVLAQGITLSELAVYQTGKITIMRDGSAVTPVTEYGAEIIEGRPTLFRAFVTTEGGFTSRELSARLILNDGTAVFTDRRTISGSSSELSANNSFMLELPPQVMTPGMNYSLSIVECGSGSGAANNPKFPDSGTAALATRTTGVIRIEAVPISDNGTAPSLDAAWASDLEGYMEAMYPTTDAQVTIASEPLTGCNVNASTSSDGGAWESCLNTLDERRSSDSPDDDVYYLGVIRPGDSIRDFCPGGCIAGISWVVEDGGWFSSYRDALAIGYMPYALTTIAHELGHAHGLYHTPGCGADGADANAPYQSGGVGYIGWTGWDNRSPEDFINGTEWTDIMTYCDDQWVSDYVYTSMTDRVASLNTASRVLGAPLVSTYRVLRVVGDDASWRAPVTKPRAVRGTPVTALLLDADGSAEGEVVVYRAEMSVGSDLVTYYYLPDSDLGSVATSIAIEGLVVELQ